MFHKIVLLLIALQISFICCYASEINMSPELKKLVSNMTTEKKDDNISLENMMQLLSNGLSKKRIMPINIQAINQDNYLLYERNAPLNRQSLHYGANKTKKIETNCIVKHISDDGVSKNINSLNNIELFQISKMYKVAKNKYVAVGYEQDMTQRSTHQATVILVDETGKTLWKTVVGVGKSYSEAMVETHSSDYVVVGYDWVSEIEDESRANYHVMVAKVNRKGNRLWTKHYSPDGRFAKGRNIEKTDDNGFVIIGETSNKAWIFKIDTLGKKVWETFFDTPRTADRAYSISDNHQDGYIIAGMSNGHGLDNDKSWIIKVNYSGKIDLNISFFLKEPFMLQTASQLSSDEFMITGFYPGTMSSNSFFIKIDLDGKQISEKVVQLKY
jgi:hypothetical protein